MTSDINLKDRKIFLEALQGLRGSAPKGELSDNFLRVLHAMEFSFDPHKVCVVAGTNGKGGVVNALSHLLTAQGVKVGSLVSPHLVDIEERVLLNGENIPTDILYEAVLEVQGVASRTGLTLEELSFFEVLVLSTMSAFRSEEVDFLVLEVGVGGKNDPVAQVPHTFNILTSVDFDHVDILGPGLEDILMQKLAILKQSGQMITGVEQDHLSKKIKQQCIALSSTLEFCPEVSYSVESEMTRFYYKGMEFSTRYFGRYGARNLMMALMQFESLAKFHGFSIDWNIVKSSLVDLQWRGRMQRVPWVLKSQLWLSGDHNPKGWSVLKDNIKEIKFERLTVIFNLGQKKSAEEFLEIFRDLPIDNLISVEAGYTCKKLDQLPREWNGKNINKYYDFTDIAWPEFSDQESSKDLVLVCGSLYFVGDFLAYFRESSLKISD